MRKFPIVVTALVVCFTSIAFPQSSEKADTENSSSRCEADEDSTAPKLNSNSVSYEIGNKNPCLDSPTLFVAIARGEKYIEPKANQNTYVVKLGDQIQIWIHMSNRAKWNKVSDKGVAKNIRLRVKDTLIGKTKHRIDVEFKGENTNLVKASAHLVLEKSDTTLVASNGKLFDWQFQELSVKPFRVLNQEILISYLPPTKAENLNIAFQLDVTEKKVDEEYKDEDKPIRIPSPYTYFKNIQIDTVNKAWEVVRAKHYDRLLKGVNWEKVKGEFGSKVRKVYSIDEFYLLMHEMLSRIGGSHLNFIPPNQTVESFSENDEVGHPGINVREIDGRFVVTDVEDRSSAFQHGVRLGWELLSIDDFVLGVDFVKRLKFSNSKQNRWQTIQSLLVGKSDTPVKMEFIDYRGKKTSKTLLRKVVVREQVKGEESFIASPLNDFKVKLLDDKILYVYFNLFTLENAETFCKTLRNYRNAKGLILDLRGNSGGNILAGNLVAGALIKKSVEIGKLTQRKGIETKLNTNEYREPFINPVIVLTDYTSRSTSEIVVEVLKRSGRAAIIGTRTGGGVEASTFVDLPIGKLQVPFASFRTELGQVIEGTGVKPSITVPLRIDLLKKGRDSQMEKGLETLESLIEKRDKNKTSILASNRKKSVVETHPKNVKRKMLPKPVFDKKSIEILNRFENVIGGKALDRIKTRRIMAVRVFDGIQVETVIFQKSPNLQEEHLLQNTIFAPPVYRLWNEKGNFEVSKFSANEDVFSREMFNINPAEQIRQNFLTLKYVGKERMLVTEEVCDVLEGKNNENEITKLYFLDGFLIGEKTEDEITVHSEYVSFDDVYIARKRTSFDSGTTELVESVEYRSVENHVNLENITFTLEGTCLRGSVVK